MIAYPIAVDGLMTRVLEAGSGDDVVVFIHGLGARADRWRRNLDVFAQHGLHCYAIDLPGHGFATKGKEVPNDVPSMARFLGAFLDTAGIRNPILIGTSLGGHIVGLFACNHPSDIRALVLVGAVGLIPLGPDTGEAIRRSVRQTSRSAVEQKLRLVLANADLITADFIDEEVSINNSAGAAESFALLGDYIAGQIDRDNIGNRLKTLIGRIPLLLVWGAEDKSVPLAIGQRAKELLSPSDLLVIPGAGHAPYMDNPTTFNEKVLRFISANALRMG